MNDELSQTELAKALGLSKSRITAMKKDGMPTDSIEAALAWRKAWQNIARRKPTPRAHASEGRAEKPGVEMSHNEARTRREIAEASMAEIKLGEMQGKYVVKAEVDSASFEIARALRDGLTNCARRIGADVAGLSDAVDCEAVIDREHRVLLDSMAHSLASKLSANAEGPINDQ